MTTMTFAPPGAIDERNRVDAIAALRDAARLLAMPGVWTQGAEARLPNGRACAPNDNRAVRFGLSGALDRSIGRFGQLSGVYGVAVRAMMALAPAPVDGKTATLGRFNDASVDAGAPVALALAAADALEAGELPHVLTPVSIRNAGA